VVSSGELARMDDWRATLRDISRCEGEPRKERAWGWGRKVSGGVAAGRRELRSMCHCVARTVWLTGAFFEKSLGVTFIGIIDG
jgi:hypothetical protein